jgi:DNA repair protein RecN (Recombination protein N)
MIKELILKSFALIDELSIQFSKGFNVLTGETGAGKSLILHGIELLLGAKPSFEEIKSDSTYSLIQGVFEIKNEKIINYLKEKGIEIENSEIIIKRVITKDGKSKIYINGEIVPLSLLKEISSKLIDFHGQHEQQSLLKKENHLILLDKFGNLLSLREEVEKLYYEINTLKNKKNALAMSEQEKAQRISLLEYQLNEINLANLVPNEEESLLQERTILLNAEKITRLLTEIYNLIYEDEGSILAKLTKVINNLNELVLIDESMRNELEICKKSKIELNELVYTLKKYLDKVEFNPDRINQVEERLDTINRLKKKYGGSVEAIKEYKNKIEHELASFVKENEELKEIDEEINKKMILYFDKATKLSLKRKNVAKQLKKNIEKELKEIGMKNIVFETKFEKLEFSPFGIDEIEFLISTNVGEEPKPLIKIASGGEMSRIMLAFKSILAEVDEIPILVFDEVDTGIGGRVAQVVGEKLKFVSSQHQVICVTHLAQIASFADQHFYIHKEVINGATRIFVEELNNKEKVIEELAKMISGEKLTPIAIKHAEELYTRAKKNEKI